MRVLIIFDVSKSMVAAYESGTRMDAAKKMAYNLIDTLTGKPDMQMALRIYGAGVEYPPGSCTDSKLIFPFERNNSTRIKNFISGLKPTGTTPIAYSLEQAANDFADKSTKNYIVVITDGIEECDGDICQVAIKLGEKGIVLRPFIIGIGLTEEQSREFECIGSYFNAEKEITFSNLSNVIISQILNPTSAQINLLDNKGKVSETNIAMNLYDLKDNMREHSFIHTFNRQNNPDTMYLDVYRKYRIKINTIPPVQIDTAVQLLGKHNIFAADAAQGELRLLMKSAIQGSEPYCVVRKEGKMETLNFQKFNTNEKYLCGTYDLEIMTLPRIILNDVKLTPDGKTIEVPVSGQLQIQSKEKIIGAIMIGKGNTYEWVCNLPPDGIQSFSIFLQPGNYILVFREKDADSTLDTYKRNFILRERGSVILNITK